MASKAVGDRVQKPPPNQRHIFRKGEPYAQILLVPKHIDYELVKMSPEEAAARRDLEAAIEATRLTLANHKWQNARGLQLDNHYKILTQDLRTARDGGR